MEAQGKAVLILPDALPERTSKGIIVPATAKEKPNRGIVIEAGHACTEVSTGDKVHYARKSASIVMIKGVEHHFIFEDKIFYIE